MHGHESASQSQLRRLINTFNVKVYVLQDNGDTAIVLVDPVDREPCPRSNDTAIAWQRVTEPCLMLIDPSRAAYARVVH
jgi:molybdenum cofactor biosynthesis enzyme MoaA